MFVKKLFIITFCLIVSLNFIITCSVAQDMDNPQMEFVNNDSQNIKQLIKQAVEYAWWSDIPNYREDLKKFYTGPTLENITKTIEQYKDNSTDWYSLTFLENCHIVYNNGNISIVIISIKEIDVTTDNVQNGRGVFILHKTNDGWRIKEMNYYWYPDNN